MNRRTRYFTALSLAALSVAMAGCGSDNPSAPTVDTVAPTVSATNPNNGATGVAVMVATRCEQLTGKGDRSNQT